MSDELKSMMTIETLIHNVNFDMKGVDEFIDESRHLATMQEEAELHDLAFKMYEACTHLSIAITDINYRLRAEMYPDEE